MIGKYSKKILKRLTRLKHILLKGTLKIKIDSEEFHKDQEAQIHQRMRQMMREKDQKEREKERKPHLRKTERKKREQHGQSEQQQDDFQSFMSIRF